MQRHIEAAETLIHFQSQKSNEEKISSVCHQLKTRRQLLRKLQNEHEDSRRRIDDDICQGRWEDLGCLIRKHFDIERLIEEEIRNIERIEIVTAFWMHKHNVCQTASVRTKQECTEAGIIHYLFAPKTRYIDVLRFRPNILKKHGLKFGI